MTRHLSRSPWRRSALLPPLFFSFFLLSLTLRQPTGNESLVEKWILHKLNLTSEDINKQLTERNFMAATTSVYSFWQYELCDVYIVRLPHAPLFALRLTGASAGGDEADDGGVGVGCDEALGAADIVHLPGPWPAAAAPIHAVRDRGTVAAPTAAAERPVPVDHGRGVPDLCASLSGLRARKAD